MLNFERIKQSLNMATSKITYTGDLRTVSTHLLSGVQILTDAPPDNQGKGEAFSPTDLLANSLGNCMLTIMGIAARTHGFNINGTEAEITKIMASDPRRVAEVQVKFTLPSNGFTLKEKDIIERAARTCPVAYSLHPDIKQTISFEYL